MIICNATKQELINAGLSILGNCTIEGCGLPVARHSRDKATAEIAQQVPAVEVHVNSIRKRRWDIINPILEEEIRKSGMKEKSSILFSKLSWGKLARAFPMDKLVLDISSVSIPSLSQDLLYEQLLVIHRLFGSVKSDKEAKLLQFISPILISVCQLLPSVHISVEEDMSGVYVRANGRFEFVLEHKGKKVCIVEAKKDDMEQGQVQSLLGCEVVAEIEGLSTVYAIVTNYIEWMVFKNTDDITYSCLRTIELENDIPSKESLGKVTRMIFAILTEIETESAVVAEAEKQSKVGSTCWRAHKIEELAD